MNRFFLNAVLFAVITSVVWVAVLWQWESTSRNMTVGDIALYLAALPLLIFAVWLGLRWAWQGAALRQNAAGADALQMAPVTHAGAAEASAREEAQRHAMVQLLAAHLVSQAGADPNEVLTAAGANSPTPCLDAELRDAEGLAVMTARIDFAPVDSFEEALARSLKTASAQRAAWAAATIDEHAVRALALLADPLAAALRSLQPWAVRLGATDPAEAPSLSVQHSARPDASYRAPPMLRVLLGWPSDWSDFTREVATTWARGLITAGTELPTERVAIVGLPVASGADLWRDAEQLLHTLAREQVDDIVLLTACHSDLSTAAIASLDQDRRLFSAQNNACGLMPGEVAVTLLLANPDWPSDPDASAPPVQLHRAAVIRRDRSIEAIARVSSDDLQNCAQQALAAAQADASEIKAMVTDADRHTPRGPELFHAAQPLLPHLDSKLDMRLIGSVTGHTGIASTLLTIASAAHRAQVDDGPCLALSVGDAFMRLALVARPLTWRDAVTG